MTTTGTITGKDTNPFSEGHKKPYSDGQKNQSAQRKNHHISQEDSRKPKIGENSIGQTKKLWTKKPPRRIVDVPVLDNNYKQLVNSILVLRYIDNHLYN